LARNDNSRSGNQELQHFELPNSQPNRLISPTKLHLWKIQEEFPKMRPLTNSPQLKIDRVRVCSCHAISLVTQVSFSTQSPCHKKVILLLNPCSWNDLSNSGLPRWGALGPRQSLQYPRGWRTVASRTWMPEVVEEPTSRLSTELFDKRIYAPPTHSSSNRTRP
jgi:hypothetical protein